MRSVRKGRKKKKGTYQFRTNHITNQRKKIGKHKKIPETSIEENWDKKKTVKKNLAEMGLVYDLKDCLAIPSTKDVIGPGDHGITESKEDKPKVQNTRNPEKSSKVLSVLEEKAQMERETAPRKSNPEVLFCVSMIERYGDDYARMARDRKNYYQETANQIKKKIVHFRKTHQYRAYLAAKSGLASLG